MNYLRLYRRNRLDARIVEKPVIESGNFWIDLEIYENKTEVKSVNDILLDIDYEIEKEMIISYKELMEVQ